MRRRRLLRLANESNKLWFDKQPSEREILKMIIAKSLKQVLLEGGAFSRALFDLEKRIAAYLQSKREDGDKYFVVIAE